MIQSGSRKNSGRDHEEGVDADRGRRVRRLRSASLGGIDGGHAAPPAAARM